jgi:ABC-type glycerol-3-phosphate transport system substrate-binding protein
LLAACASPAGTEVPSGAPTGPSALSGTITLLTEGADPSSEPSLKKVYDDFKTQNPAIDWDIRAIQGLGPDWDRLARAALEAGEPIGLVMLDGLFIRAWARDGSAGRP